MAVIKYRDKDGTLKEVGCYNIAKYDLATEEADGLMSAEDKIKLDAMVSEVTDITSITNDEIDEICV